MSELEKQEGAQNAIPVLLAGARGIDSVDAPPQWTPNGFGRVDDFVAVESLQFQQGSTRLNRRAPSPYSASS